MILEPHIAQEIARDATDMGIIEDVSGDQMVVHLGQQGAAQGFFNADREVLSYRIDDIDRAIVQFERLLSHSIPANELFPELQPHLD